jgi:predicted secreted protein
MVGASLMKYFKDQNGSVWAFEADGSQDDLITEDFVTMTVDEIDRHINPQNYLSDEEKEQLRLAQFLSLTRRQFKLALHENNLLDTVEQTINAIEDPTLKTRIQIEYNESERFERSNQSVQYMLGILNLTADQVDEMWLYAATL